MIKIRGLLVLAAVVCAGCEGFILVDGYVLDATTGAPLRGAVITLSIGSRSYIPDTTDAGGHFSAETGLVGMVGGGPTVTLTATRKGYRDTSLIIDNGAGATVTVSMMPE